MCMEVRSEQSHAARFSLWGLRFGFWDCVLVTLRGQEDSLNPIMAGFLMVFDRRTFRKRLSTRLRKARKNMIFLIIFEVLTFLPQFADKYLNSAAMDWAGPGSEEEHPWEAWRRSIEQRMADHVQRYHVRSMLFRYPAPTRGFFFLLHFPLSLFLSSFFFIYEMHSSPF